MDLKITRPFAIFFYEDDSSDLTDGPVWLAHVVGADGLDNITQAQNPVDAVFMAHDLMLALTDLCGHPAQEHDYSIESKFDLIGYVGEPVPGNAWECTRCGAKTARKS